jgi:hypothetical protein
MHVSRSKEWENGRDGEGVKTHRGGGAGSVGGSMYLCVEQCSSLDGCGLCDCCGLCGSEMHL